MRLVITLRLGKRSREVRSRLIAIDGIDLSLFDVIRLAEEAGMYSSEEVSGWRTVYN